MIPSRPERDNKTLSYIHHDINECIQKGEMECLADYGGKQYSIVSASWSIFENAENNLLQAYFCGAGTKCMTAHSHWALQRAKENLVRFYPVVGVLERYKDTLALLESELPLFFKEATIQYKHMHGKRKLLGVAI